MKKVSLRRPGFSLGDVETILGEMFGFDPTKRSTFSARLQQIQRLGLPPSANPGRGTRFRYAYWQLAEFALYVDLLDVGMPPNLIKQHFADGGFYLPSGIGVAIEEGGDDATYLFIKPGALDYLRTAATAERGRPVFQIIRGAAEVVSREAPAIIINLSRRLHDLRAAVDKIVPEETGNDMFRSASAPGAAQE